MLLQCSVNCGSGLQHRAVECVERNSGKISDQCSTAVKPSVSKKCNQGICRVTEFGKIKLLNLLSVIYNAVNQGLSTFRCRKCLGKFPNNVCDIYVVELWQCFIKK